MNWYAVATLRKYKIRLYCLPQSPDNPLVMKHGIILFRFKYTFYFILVLWYYNCLSDSNGFFYETCPECRGNHIIFNVQQSSSLQVSYFHTIICHFSNNFNFTVPTFLCLGFPSFASNEFQVDFTPTLLVTLRKAARSVQMDLTFHSTIHLENQFGIAKRVP